ncbi:MAG TPA: transcription termination/antitermination NusG family protein, partial [Aeromicrobium sp.]|nr:transcription termination/antitermination NusG family protein [Aeromicrobium sp.]
MVSEFEHESGDPADGSQVVDTIDDAPAEDAPAEDVTEDAATDEASTQEEAATDAASTDEAPTQDEVVPDALKEFRDNLYSQPGDWYVVHTYSGMEKRVKANLENRITSLNAEDYIFQVEVPTEEVAEIKNGQRKLVKRTVLPGYVLVRMDLTDESWGVVRHTPSVTGFVGNAHQPVPLSLDEVETMLAPAIEAEVAAAAAPEGTAPTSVTRQKAKAPKVEFADF